MAVGFTDNVEDSCNTVYVVLIVNRHHADLGGTAWKCACCPVVYHLGFLAAVTDGERLWVMHAGPRPRTAHCCLLGGSTVGSNGCWLVMACRHLPCCQGEEAEGSGKGTGQGRSKGDKEGPVMRPHCSSKAVLIACAL